MQYLKNKKIKVLICAFACLRDPDTRFGFGKGGESGLGWNIIKQIEKFAEVFVLTEFGNKEEIEGRIAIENLSKVKFYYISLPKILFFSKKIIQIYTYLWQIKAYFVAKKLHKKINFDVFHHVTYANDWMASYIGALLPIPYIRGPGGGAHRVPKKFVREYSFKNHLAERVRSIGQWLFRHDPVFIIGQNKAKAILVCNQEAFNGLPEKWQKKAYFYPVNGISKDDFLKFGLNKGENGKSFSVLTAGKLLKIKGFDLAIKVFKNFSQKAPSAKLIIAGSGPELENLKGMAEGLGLSDKVVFLGWVPREELFEEIMSCDVFLFPSLRDGGGNVVVEALAAGKPVVCFDIAGPGFHIDAKCGIKVKPESPEQAIRDFSNALDRLYFNGELLKELGNGAREKAEREYSWEKLGDKLKDIYEKVL